MLRRSRRTLTLALATSLLVTAFATGVASAEPGDDADAVADTAPDAVGPDVPTASLGSAPPTTTPAPTPAEGPADPPVTEGGIDRVPDAVPGEYIVTLADDSVAVRPTAADLAADHEGDVLRTYRHALRGFAVEMTEAQALELSKDPRVAAVEENAVVRVDTTQSGATWGLDRIDQRDLPLSTTYSYTATGTGVDVYIVDTGIRISHQEFGGRASIGMDAIGDGQNGNDCNGHGTHVAGTVGGSTFGVAKSVSLIAVRVLNCAGSGTTAAILAGIDYITANHSGPSVANLSLGYGAVVTSVDTAVQNSIASGVTYAIAAGNDNVDACGNTPGRTPEAITVGSTTSTDARSSFSNFGTCLDIFAPGSSITSSWITNDTATNTISGTSMATPHVAGAAALFLQTSPAATPAQVATRLIGDSTPNKVSSPGTGSPNRLLYSGNIVLGASITLAQDSVADSAQDFAYSVTCQNGPCGAFTLDDDADGAVPRQVRGDNVANGTYTITQAAVAGWTLTDIVCNTGETVQLANRRVIIDVTTNEQVSCTFTNRSPSITIVQNAAPDAAQDFSFTGCQGGCGVPFLLDDDSSSATPRSVSGSGLTPGTYVVTQAAVANWPLTSLVCDTGEVIDLVNRRATITLGATEHATCTWTNSSATLTIVQDSVPDEAQDYNFDGCLVGSSCSAFTLDDDADPTRPRSIRGDGLAPGTYTLTQAAVPGRELFALACDTGESIDLVNRRATVSLSAGEQVTCTFSNRPVPPPNDAFANAQTISGTSGSVAGTNVNATKESGEPSHGGNAGARSVWYQWTAPSSGSRTFTMCGGASFDTLINAYTGSAVNALTSVAGNDDACSLQSSITITATAGVTYRIAVDGYSGASGPFTLSWS